MILYIVARNRQEYDRVADAVLEKLNTDHDETFGAVVPVNGVADLQLPYRRLPGQPNVLLSPRHKDRRDWGEIESCLINIGAKVIFYADFIQESHQQLQCEGTH